MTITNDTITDNGRHYRADIARILQPDSIEGLRDLVLLAHSEGRKIAVRGAAKSQGGLILCDDAIVVDTTRLNRILDIDPNGCTVQAQAGVTWDELRLAISPQGLSPASNQSYGVFSIGGSVSVNAHGRNVDCGVLAGTILSLRVMLADGSVVEASRTQNSELFSLVIGGLGLFGIVIDVTLALVPNDIYVRSCVAAMPTEQYPHYFAKCVLADPEVHFHYARFDVSEGKMLERLFCVEFRRDREDMGQELGNEVREVEDVRFQRATLWCFRKFRWARRLRFWGDVIYRIKSERTRRNNVAKESWKAIERHHSKEADWLQEFFIPPDQFVNFVSQAQQVFKEEGFRPLNITVRFLPQNRDAFLSYARQDCFSFVLFYEQRLDPAAIAKTEQVLRRLLDCAIACGGTYYLCYHRFAEPAQLHRAYPEIEAFFTLKRKHDPDEIFVNQFYQHYAVPVHPVPVPQMNQRSIRPLRLSAPQHFDLKTADGTDLILERYRGGDKGPIVLAPGYSMSNKVFTLDTIDTNLAEYLYGRGYDVWLFSWRSCPELGASRSRFVLDDVALYDWPAAVDFVRDHTRTDQVDCVVHCIGSQTLLMSLGLGKLAGKVRSALCLQVGLHYDQPFLTRLKAFMRTADVLEFLGLAYLSQSDRIKSWPYRLLDALLTLYPVDARQRCGNVTCRRSTFIWGELVNHANINNATHARMNDFLGDAAMHAIVHMTRGIRRKRILRQDGADIYLAAPDEFRIPITFIHGADNLTVRAGSTWNTREFLAANNGADLYRYHSIAGYGHMDCLIGQSAADDVFPYIGAHLDWVTGLTVNPSRLLAGLPGE